MLSITKINSASAKSGRPNQGGYLFYLDSPTTREKSDFDEYARAAAGDGAPLPFWACSGSALLGLSGAADPDQVQLLAEGFHPTTRAPMLRGAGAGHVMGADLTFSAPKDVSAVFAGSDQVTQKAIEAAMRGAVETALGYAEFISVTRHGRGGRVKQLAEAVIAACYPHFASRALDPQLHIHAFVFNAGKRRGAEEWSALDQKSQFDHKMATGALFRVELADRLRRLGFQIAPQGPYFAIQGVEDFQREALSQRSQQINAYLAERGMLDANSAAAREVASLNTRSGKAEPPYRELIERFKSAAATLGITPSFVDSLRRPEPAVIEEAFALDHEALTSELFENKSVAAAQDALALICEKAMGRWGAARCLSELEAFLSHSAVRSLGKTEHLSRVITSSAMLGLESDISARAERGAASTVHRAPAADVAEAFDALERELEAKVGAKVDLSQQRKAALHVCSETGDHAFVEGWAGAGKTTMLKAVGEIYANAGFNVIGCSQAAAAAQNLARETGIRSSTIASLLLAIDLGRLPLTAKSIVILDEAGMVGSRELGLLQERVIGAGGKLICVGDAKQLQPIAAGGIFRSLIARHGGAEISSIQRQRTDFGPLFDWLSGATGRRAPLLPKGYLAALRTLPEDAVQPALDELAAKDDRLAYGLQKWRARFDHKWMREAVELFANGDAAAALSLMDERGRLELISDGPQAMEALISAWDADKTPLADKAIIAGTRAEVRELNRLARAKLLDKGAVQAERALPVEIELRDGSREEREFSPGDRLVFTKNDKALGVANGSLGSIASIRRTSEGPAFVVRLDDPNPRGEREAMIPASFACFDHAYCLTNHKSQGRTFDSARVYVNAAMADREWTYVAASRARHATTLYVNAASLAMIDCESHRDGADDPKTRAAHIDALASRMSRSRAKGTTLDYAEASAGEPARETVLAKLARVASELRGVNRDLLNAVASLRSTRRADALAAERSRERSR